jgi:hypothetical protein
MLVAVVIVLFLVITYFIYKNSAQNEDYLYGFWLADGDDFCARSGINSMLLFIGRPDSGWLSVTRPCYIIIMNNLCNQGLTLTYSPRYWPGSYGLDVRAEFDDESIWPENVRVTTDIHTGTLVVTSGDTIYAELTKQHDTTNAARLFEDYELTD